MHKQEASPTKRMLAGAGPGQYMAILGSVQAQRNRVYEFCADAEKGAEAMKTAKQLLESDNLLAEPEVVETYWRQKDYPCVIREIPPHLSLADAAEEMRDACQRNEIAGGKGHWNKELGNITGNGDTYNLLFATAKQRIIAAVMAERGEG